LVKAISLLSGGLDSILATKLILEQGVEVEALNFATVFYACPSKGKACPDSKSAADNLGIPLKVFEINSKEYFDIIKKPKYGYGSNMNPCLDCRIFMLRKAGEYMKKTGASFIITGEVLGERPMSQRRDAMRIIERDSGLEGFILRPLSAKLFEPTIAEKKGLVDREKLLSIKGRSRKPQIKLAKELSINDYPSPAGGCLLTDPGFAKRIKDLMEHNPDFTINDVQLLKTGRHFRLSERAKLIVGRNKEENDRLLSLASKDDMRLYPVGVKGPVGIIRGRVNEEILFTASGIIARYSDSTPEEELQILHKTTEDNPPECTKVLPLDNLHLANLRI
jgi:tRNA U34 2-thiouridine synthase MnmA/TrmU